MIKSEAFNSSGVEHERFSSPLERTEGFDGIEPGRSHRRVQAKEDPNTC